MISCPIATAREGAKPRNNNNNNGNCFPLVGSGRRLLPSPSEFGRIVAIVDGT